LLLDKFASNQGVRALFVLITDRLEFSSRHETSEAVAAVALLHKSTTTEKGRSKRFWDLGRSGAFRERDFLFSREKRR